MGARVTRGEEARAVGGVGITNSAPEGQGNKYRHLRLYYASRISIMDGNGLLPVGKSSTSDDERDTPLPDQYANTRKLCRH